MENGDIHIGILIEIEYILASSRLKTLLIDSVGMMDWPSDPAY
jgi:hypothetical protein